MPTFIKAGFWEKMCNPCNGYKGWLNLDKLIESLGGTGPQGPQGIQGVQGPQGIQGVQGVQGETGAALTVLGSYPNLAAFEAGAGGEPGNPGEAWLIESDGSLYIWNTATSAWEDVGDLQGPQGIQGVQGPQGEQGIQGVQGIQGTPGVNSTGFYGSFYDTTDQTGVSGNILTMSLNNSDSWNNGVSLVSGTRFTIANPGVYNIAFSAQMLKQSGNTASHAHIWLSQNGTSVPNSSSQIGFPSNSVYIVAAWNFFFKTTVVNEYVELKWEINSNVNNQLFIKSSIASGNVPAIPGLIVTVNKVN